MSAEGKAGPGAPWARHPRGFGDDVDAEAVAARRAADRDESQDAAERARRERAQAAAAVAWRAFEGSEVASSRRRGSNPDGWSKDRWEGRPDRVEVAQRRLTWSGALVAALRHPVRLVPLAFLGVILLGTALLMLPIAHVSGRPDAMVASFTTVSAVCVTGLVTVDTATYWTPVGQAIIIVLIQVGGLGIMTLATLLSLLVRGRLRVRNQLVARAETHTFDVGDVRRVVARVAVSMLSAEAVIAVLLTARFYAVYDDSLRTALWHGVFHSISAFNNAGFGLYSSNLVGFVSDVWIVGPICAAIVAGGLGYPVFFELLRTWRTPRRWSAHTRITVWGTLLLLVGGTVAYLVFEGGNPGTLGPLAGGDKVTAAATASVVARTAGFNSIDYGLITPATLVITLGLMFIGGGSAGTAGGVKVTTFFLLAHLIVAEIRGEEDVVVGRRRIGAGTIRAAVSVALLGVGAVMTGTVLMVAMTGLPLDRVAFEVISAFGTVGLSTGITGQLEPKAQLVLMMLMFVGRVGTVTVASALALRDRKRHYHYPEERPIVG